MSQILCCTALLFVACDRKNTSETKGIIGEDSRVGTNEYADFVGKIEGGNGTCTAYISGVNEVTTAAHCFAEEDDLASQSFQKLNGESVKIESVKSFHYNADIVLLNAAVGANFLSYASYSDSESKK
jgi:hypothetical protein